MFFECLVTQNLLRCGKITKRIIRWFESEEYAFAWLELEGYKVISIKELPNNQKHNHQEGAKDVYRTMG